MDKVLSAIFMKGKERGLRKTFDFSREGKEGEVCWEVFFGHIYKWKGREEPLKASRSFLCRESRRGVWGKLLRPYL